METVEYDGLKILSGINTHPGSGNVFQHEHEIRLFKSIIEDVDPNNPVMIEIGSFWGLWSLLFRKKFENGKNILIELGKRQLYVGLRNFYNNRFDCAFYHGGFNVEDSQTFENRKFDIEYDTYADADVNIDNLISSDEELRGYFECMEMTGKNLEFEKIITENKIDEISLLHMDIQGSELNLIRDIRSYLKSKKIINLVVATHSSQIHEEIINILKSYEYKILIESEYGSIGGDGYIYAKI